MPSYIHEPINTRVASPDRDLWSAVMRQALDDLRDRVEFPRALAWFRSREIDEGSFEWICMILDMEPSRVREMVQQSLVRRVVEHEMVKIEDMELEAA
jgi:hypothetical protein